MGLHEIREEFVIKIFEKTVKRPIRRKRTRNIEAAKMSDQKVIVEVINEIGDHGEPFTLHNDEGTDHGMIGKAFSPGGRICRDAG